MITPETRLKWGTLTCCSLSCFVAWLDFAIVNTALPAIQESLSASLAQLQWVMNAYVLAISTLIVMLGRISDHIGRKTINLIGVFCLGLFSLLAGLAPSPFPLILCRFMQGAASAAIIPTSIALISHTFPGKEKGKAIAIWSGATGLGMAIGPVLGGFLVSALSWRWIFFLNVPFALLSLLLSTLLLQESKSPTTALKPDYKGFSLLILGLGSLTWGLIHAPDWGWLSTSLLLLAGIAFLLLFYFLEQRSPAPTIPFSLFSNTHFLYATLVMFGLIFVFTAALFLIPLYLIQVRHQAAYEAGLTIFPITGCIALLSPLMGTLMIRYSVKTLFLTGLAFFFLSTFMQSFISPETSLSFLILSFICLGIGWTIARVPATTSAVQSVPDAYTGTASGVLWTIQNSGGALSIAITITLFGTLSGTSFLTGYRTAMHLLSAVTLIIFGLIAFSFKKRSL